MMSIPQILSDPYELKARIIPGLLVVLPILVPLVAVYGVKHPVLTGVFGVIGGCGAIYTLASISRGLGKRLEDKLIRMWGGMPTTILLRHRDSFLDSVSKSRYHDAIYSKLGIQLPTSEEEAADPLKADDKYIGATKRLREVTRGEKGLLFKENIAYGFHRNMLAMKPVGIFTSSISLLYSLLEAKVITLDTPYFRIANFGEFSLAPGLNLIVSLVLLATWLFYFNEEAVRRVGFAYAERLFECLPEMKKSASGRRTTGST